MSTGSSSSHGSRNGNALFTYSETHTIPSASPRVSRPLAMSQQVPAFQNQGPGLGQSGSVSASSLLVAQMLTGSVNAVAGVAAPFGLIFSGAMEGVESGRNSVSGVAAIGDRETTMGYTSDQEMEGGHMASPSVPNVPGYGDLRIIYAIVCVPYILQDIS